MSRTLGQKSVDDYRILKAATGPKLVSKPQSSPGRHLPPASPRPAAPIHGTVSNSVVVTGAPPPDTDNERRASESSLGPVWTAGQSLSVGSLGGGHVEKATSRKRTRGLSEGDVTQLLRRYHHIFPGRKSSQPRGAGELRPILTVSVPSVRRYASPLLMALVREIARTTTSKLDWSAIQKKALPGLKSARECQAIWRLIAYGAPIQGDFEDNADPTVPSWRTTQPFPPSTPTAIRPSHRNGNSDDVSPPISL